ncbi:hypothetical protein ElyMa_001126300 [Elysia marginata]|uniref:Uncharacterized protein n=1 Tax=Elysia marginata TaxID=1093978 RepID=A0AAV4HWF4_9GAST|nr:hypothetical protein ElyMa_001126300 [Elysia marginata]
MSVLITTAQNRFEPLPNTNCFITYQTFSRMSPNGCVATTTTLELTMSFHNSVLYLDHAHKGLFNYCSADLQSDATIRSLSHERVGSTPAVHVSVCSDILTKTYWLWQTINGGAMPGEKPSGVLMQMKKRRKEVEG